MSLASRPRQLRTVAATAVALAGLGVAVPASQAAPTVTALGKCTAPTPPYPTLERITVPGTVKVGTDGRPTGASIGISIRNFTETYKGSGVDLYVDVIDTSTGKSVGRVNEISWAGCARYLWSMREFTYYDAKTATTSPLKLKRGQLYLARASAGFVDWFGGADPLAGVNQLLNSPSALFVAV